VYEQVQEVLGKGLSPGARIFLGLISGLFGLMMILYPPGMTKPIAIYGFGAFCLVICIMCITKGVVRNFLGRVIGAITFCLSMWYFYGEITSGPVVYGSKSQPSVLDAILFFFAFGLPGAWFAIKGHFHRKQNTNDENL